MECNTKLTCLTVIAALGVVSCERSPEGPAPWALNDSLAVNLSSEYSHVIGDSIGKAVEAKFLNGDRLVVLDGFSPHLRLFTTGGELLWTGGYRGDGPSELRNPKGIAARGDEAVVVQQGRLSFLKFENDSVVIGSTALPPWLIPQGVEYGCDGEILIYGRDNSEFRIDGVDSEDVAPEVTWLHMLMPNGQGDIDIVGVWKEPRASAGARNNHRGAVLDRSESTLVVFHRMSPFGGGRLLSFDCDLGMTLALDENRLVKGDSLQVIEPRPKAMQWTNGMVALPDGFLVALCRWFTPTARGERAYQKTELFHFRDGQFRSSMLLDRQWFLLDYDLRHGLLMTSDDPKPHFVIVPPAALGQSGRLRSPTGI